MPCGSYIIRKDGKLIPNLEDEAMMLRQALRESFGQQDDVTLSLSKSEDKDEDKNEDEDKEEIKK